jgi:hypothetical protein
VGKDAGIVRQRNRESRLPCPARAADGTGRVAARRQPRDEPVQDLLTADEIRRLCGNAVEQRKTRIGGRRRLLPDEEVDVLRGVALKNRGSRSWAGAWCRG